VLDEYSPEWIGRAGLDLGPGYCITIALAISSTEALRRAGVPGVLPRVYDALRREARLLGGDYVPVAAFEVGGHAVLVEENGGMGLYRWGGPLSMGTVAVTAYLSPSSGAERLVITRDGAAVAEVDADEPEVVRTDDPALREVLLELVADAFQPFEDEDDPDADGMPDLLRVACEYVGIHPSVHDVAVPAPGAPVRFTA
jgi:hypothetical protein